MTQVAIKASAIKDTRKWVYPSVGQLIGSLFEGGNCVFDPLDCLLNFQVLGNGDLVTKNYEIAVVLKIRFLRIAPFTDCLC